MKTLLDVHASPLSQIHGGRHRLVPFHPLSLRRGGRFGDHHTLAILSEIAELGAQTRAISSRCQSRGPAPTPSKAASVYIGYVSGSRRSLGGSRSLCLTLFYARHPVPLCMGPTRRLRTLARSLNRLHLLECPTRFNVSLGYEYEYLYSTVVATTVLYEYEYEYLIYQQRARCSGTRIYTRTRTSMTGRLQYTSTRYSTVRVQGVRVSGRYLYFSTVRVRVHRCYSLLQVRYLYS